MLTCVLGFPVAHSRSPAMMNAAFRELGLDWLYLRLPVPPERFAGVVRGLPGSGYAGANVTIPHKVAALEVANHATPTAEAIGAANTLMFFREGGIVADNTDGDGFLDALGERPRTALVLGAGGAGRAVVWALLESGVGVSVWNRTPQRARELADDMGARHVERPEPAELVVNATSVGLDGATEEEALAALPLQEPPAVFVDLVYGGRRTALCDWAERNGARVVDGLEVLVRQGARSLERWTGKNPPLEVMRAAARSSLPHRLSS